MKRAVLQGVQSTLSLTGLPSRHVKSRNACGATVLMYHSVARDPESAWIDPRYRVTPEMFETQMAFLSRHRTVVSMSEFVSALEQGREMPAGTVVLTFDDGYRDNLTVAAPILAKYGLPAILYVCTSYVSRVENQWIDRLYGLFRARTRHDLVVEEGPSGRYDLTDPDQERNAYRAASRILLEADLDRRTSYFGELQARLAPESAGPRLTLSWDEVRDLVKQHPRFEIGAHSRNHIDIPRFEGDLAEGEIRGSTEEIARELGRRPDHFSFPYNRWSPQSQERVRRNGYRSAVGSGTEYLVTGKTDRFAIPRIDFSCLPLGRLDFITSGACPGLTRSLVGLS